MGLQNISQVFMSTTCQHQRNGIVYYSPGQLLAEQQTFVAYSEMLGRTIARASLLHGMELPDNSVFLLQFDDHQKSIEWFWAVTLAGHIPALSAPLSRDDAQRMAYFDFVSDLFDHPVCLTSRKLFPQISQQADLNIFMVDDLETSNKMTYTPLMGIAKSSSDPAAIMLTSGSSGRPKAVILPHDMILHSLHGKIATLGTSAETPFLAWIGMDHVATLTEMHLQAMMVGASQTFIQATDVVKHPLAFLEAIQRHHIAHSFAPHFFLASLEKTLSAHHDSRALSALDLSSLKTIVTGGEANVVDTCVRLLSVLTRYGAPSNVLVPAWGMTETSGGSIYHRHFPKYDVPLRREFASIGKPIIGLEVRFTGDDGDKPLPADTIGHLEVRGSAVFETYHKNSEAVAESFSSGGWFKTGDNGFLDANGMLHLVGRSKDCIIVNGINYSPAAIEAALRGVDGTTDGFTVVVPRRLKDAATEDLCIIYLPSFDAYDAQSRNDTNSRLTKLVVLHTGVRPIIVPLEEAKLQKSTLGKLSRAKIQEALVNDEYIEYIAFDDEQMARYQEKNFRPPRGSIENAIASIVCESLGLAIDRLGADQSFFSVGVNSIDLIRLKSKLDQAFGFEVPLLTVMKCPTVESLASALDESNRERTYDPLVVLNSGGTRTPLWLVHPGVGEVLIFLPLASYVTDRPVYALRARGFEHGELHFATWQEARDVYIAKIRAVQPRGPYAIAGYSYGSMIAFEMGKILQTTDQIKFLGVFNLPPHISWRMRQLDWTNCILHLSYFLGFFSEDFAHHMHSKLQLKSKDEVIDWVLENAPPERVREVGLDREKLSKWAGLAFALQHSAINYEPSGKVDCIDIFCATPLASVAKGMDDWRDNHLGKWKDFSNEPPILHDVGGAHYTMLSPAYVSGFQSTLRTALAARGV